MLEAHEAGALLAQMASDNEAQAEREAAVFEARRRSFERAQAFAAVRDFNRGEQFDDTSFAGWVELIAAFYILLARQELLHRLDGTGEIGHEKANRAMRLAIAIVRAAGSDKHEAVRLLKGAWKLGGAAWEGLDACLRDWIFDYVEGHYYLHTQLEGIEDASQPAFSKPPADKGADIVDKTDTCADTSEKTPRKPPKNPNVIALAFMAADRGNEGRTIADMALEIANGDEIAADSIARQLRRHKDFADRAKRQK